MTPMSLILSQVIFSLSHQNQQLQQNIFLASDMSTPPTDGPSGTLPELAKASAVLFSLTS